MKVYIVLLVALLAANISAIFGLLAAQTRIASDQTHFLAPLRVGDGTRDGIEFAPLANPKPPDAPKYLLFVDANNSNHLSIMDSTGKVTDLQ